MLARELAEGAELTEAHISVFVLRSLIAETRELITQGDPRGVRASELCVEISDRLGELRPEAYMQLAAGHRKAGRYRAALQALDVASEAGGVAVRGAVLRRRACVHADFGEYEEAFGLARQSLDITEDREHALANAVLATVHSYRGEYRAALPHHEAALGCPDLADYQLAAALTNYTQTLAKVPEEAERALEQYEEVRRRLGEQDKLPRAKCWWGIGLAHATLGDNGMAWRSMHTGLRSLQALGLDREVALLVAEMADVSASTAAVRALADEALENVTDGVVREPLQALRKAGDAEMPAAVAKLREAASSQVEPRPQATDSPSGRPRSHKVFEIPAECEGGGCDRPPAFFVVQGDGVTALCRGCVDRLEDAAGTPARA